MSLTLNMVGGGAGGGSFDVTDAVLRVQAPVGSTVTITKGAVVKTGIGFVNAADPSVSDYYFIIKQSEFNSTAWTVAASLSGQSASSSIVINESKEFNVALSYRIYLVQNGVINTSLSTWSTNAIKYENNANLNAYAPTVSTSGGLTIGQAKSDKRSGSYATDSSIDLTGYNTLVLEFDVTTVSNSGDAYKFNCVLYANSGSSLPQYQTVGTTSGILRWAGAVTQTDQSISLNISSLTTARIGIGASGQNVNTGGTITVKNLYIDH